MANWKDYKDLGPFNFEKTLAGTSYNVGDAIVSVSNPVWSMEDKRGIPITTTHAPCGYWNNTLALIDPFERVTSRPYPIEHFDYFESLGATLESGEFRTIYKTYIIPIEAFEAIGASIQSGELRDVFKEYSMVPEAFESLGAVLNSGELKSIFVEYTDGLPEAFESLGANLQSGVFKKILITYTNGLPEAFESLGATIQSGSLV